MSERIESPTNPRIKALVRLRNRRDRDETTAFILEGYRDLVRPVDRARRPPTLYVCPKLCSGRNEPGRAPPSRATAALRPPPTSRTPATPFFRLASPSRSYMYW